MAWNRVLSLLRPRDCLEIVSGLSRDWLGSLSQKFRLELERNWFEIVSGFSRERLGEVGDDFWATFVVYSTYYPLLRRISMCSEWGLLALARRTYSSKCPLDISRCGLIASSTAAKLRRGPQSSEETQRKEVAWRLEALRYSSSPQKSADFRGPHFRVRQQGRKGWHYVPSGDLCLSFPHSNRVLWGPQIPKNSLQRFWGLGMRISRERITSRQ